MCGASWGTEGTGELPGPTPGWTSSSSSLCHQRWPLEQQPPAAGSERPKNKIKTGSKPRKFLLQKSFTLIRFLSHGVDFSQVGGLRGTGSSGTLAGLCTAPEHVARLGWAQHPWPERGPWVSSTGSRYCTEQNEVHRSGGVEIGQNGHWTTVLPHFGNCGLVPGL